MTSRFFASEQDRPHLESLERKLNAVADVDGAAVAVTADEMTALRNSALAPRQADRDDMEMFFRCMMQMARYLAKKYGFTIKQWPEK